MFRGGDTENGAYTLTADDISNNSVSRNDGWQWAVTSEDEWYKAAYHENDGDTGNYFDYPTGSDTPPTAESPPGGPNSANFDDLDGDATDVGAYTLSESPYGTFDQAGNVFEWNEAIFNGYARGLRGGFWVVGSDFFLASIQLSGTGPWNEHSYIGFRVASAPPIPGPNSLIVWSVLGALALTLGWRTTTDWCNRVTLGNARCLRKRATEVTTFWYFHFRLSQNIREDSCRCPSQSFPARTRRRPKMRRDYWGFARSSLARSRSSWPAAGWLAFLRASPRSP